MRQYQDIEDLKKSYEKIALPKDLESKTMQSIARAKKDCAKQRHSVLYFTAKLAGIAAAAMLTFVILVNSNHDIAEAMEQVSVLGKFVEAVTFRVYEDTQNDGKMGAEIQVPQITSGTQDGGQLTDSIDEMNRKIEEYTDRIITAYETWAEQTQENGYGTVHTDYEVVTDNAHLFSLRFDTSQVLAGTNRQVMIYHIDKEEDQLITIEDIFQEGTPYQEVVSECVKAQMRKRMQEDASLYYWVDDEMTSMNFQTITEDSNFYINEAQELVLVFDKYEVAPGYMGAVEIAVPKEELNDIIIEKYFE